MAISNSDIPQPLWERAVALVQKQGMPVNASTLQWAMNTLAEGGSGSAEPNVGMDSQIDALMARTDKAPVETAPLSPALPRGAVNGMMPPTRGGAAASAAQTRKPMMLDDVGMENLYNEKQGQGPASLNSHDAEAPDARGKPITPSDTANAAPGTQGMNDMGIVGEEGIVNGGGDNLAIGAGVGGAAGGIGALLATLLRRKGSTPSSRALGNGRTGQLALPAPQSGPAMPMGGPEGWYPQSNNPGMRETGIPGRKMPASAIRTAGGGSNRRPPGMKLGMGGGINSEIERLLQ